MIPARLVSFVVVAVLAAASASAPAAHALDETDFRYARALPAEGQTPVAFEPDGPLFAHARDGLADLRIVDAAGRQVPWRLLPQPRPRPRAPVRLRNRGRESGKAVALVDRGANPSPIEQIELQLPRRPFVGRVEVLGSDARPSFTFLSSTAIYDLRGARPARSTIAVFPPTDFRYLVLRASGVRTIEGATVVAARRRQEEIVSGASLQLSETGRRTVARLDLGFAQVPADVVRIRASTRRFDRAIEIAGSNGGRAFVPLAAGRIFRFDGRGQTSVPVAAAHRYLRVTISNGDDVPLRGLRLTVARRPRTVLVADGYRGPYRLLYGNPRLAEPKYDFAALPRASLGLERAVVARPGSERRNRAYRPPEDERSFIARHPALIQVALALAAIVLAVAGYVALRRRT